VAGPLSCLEAAASSQKEEEKGICTCNKAVQPAYAIESDPEAPIEAIITQHVDVIQ